MSRSLPPSVNFHLQQACNMACDFCFDTFEDVLKVAPKGRLPRAESCQLVDELARSFSKVTFVGGEPTLCPWLIDLVTRAKSSGATTMIVTNGSRIDAAYLAPFMGVLDWLTLSMDSGDPKRNIATGRAVRGMPLDPERYVEIAELARAFGMRVKLNTVVTSVNADEDMVDLVGAIRPERWKIFLVLPVAGQNDGRVEQLLISDSRFAAFIERNRRVEEFGVDLVPERNDDMRGTYAMVDPIGRFFDNSGCGYRYSKPILEVGLRDAWDEIDFDLVRFVERGGVYDWDS